MIIENPTIDDCRSVEDICITMIIRFHRLLCFSRIWAISNIASFIRVIQRNIISQETRSAGSVTTSLDLAKPFMTMKCRHIAIKWMVMINTICRTRKLGCRSPTNQRYEMAAPVVVYSDFESAIDDKNKHKPIMLSCLAVSRISAIDSQLRVFHVPHESEEDLRPFMDYLVQLHESVKTYLFDELPLESTSKVERDFRSTTMFPSVARNWRTAK